MARHRKKGPTCPNCGTQLRAEFEYCPSCGQENHDLRVPFRHFVYEFFENITHFDTKTWNTLKTIFSRPGQLTKDYVEGRRARYVHPARFYVFTSLIFFALLSIHLDRRAASTQGPRMLGDEVVTERRLADLVHAIPDSVRHALGWKRLRMDDVHVSVPIDAPFYRATSAHLRKASDEVIDSLLRIEDMDTLSGTKAALRSALASLPEADSLNIPYRVMLNGLPASFSLRSEEALFRKGDLTDADVDSLLGDQRDSVSWFERQFIRSLGRVDLSTTRGKQQMARATVKAVSVIMFLLMPFTAVLLLWIFFRRRYYWEHLIFSVHIHTIYFIFFITALTVGLLVPWELPDAITVGLFLACLVYLLASLRRVYGHGWWSTVWRAAVMGVPYIVAFACLMVAGVIWGFFSL